jgi:hypothetical protein
MNAEGHPVLSAIRNRRGLATQIGNHLGITRAAVWGWQRVPPKHALNVARFMKLHPHEVCPDLYPPPRKARSGTRTLQQNG